MSTADKSRRPEGSVRLANWETDKDSIIEGALAFAANIEYGDEMLDDPVQFIGVLYQTIHNPNVVSLVHEENGEVNAALLFSILPMHWAPQVLVTQEVAFYNLSAGPHAALRLLRAYEKEARRRGAQILNLTHLTTSDPRVGAVYERMGAHPTEHTYTKRM